MLSSSMVFESTTVFPTPEGAERTSPPPISTYGFQKLASEYFAHGAWEQYQLPYTILRPFNCVGIGERRAVRDTDIMSGNVKLALSHVVPDLVLKTLKGQDPLHILGDGSQVRHYTYGGDLARGIRLAMESDAAVNDDFNLSTAASTTVLELAEAIWTAVHGPEKPFRYVSDPPFEHDVQLRVPDVRKAGRVLGFEATTSLDDDARRGHPLDPRRARGGTAVTAARWRTVGRILLGIGLSAFALLLLARTVDVPGTVDRLAAIDPRWLVLPLGVLAIEFVLRAQRWSLLLRGAGAAVPTRRVMAPLAVSYLANAVLPARVGEVARTLLVARRERLAIALVAASVIIERVLDLAALLSVGLVGTAAVGAIGLIGWAAIGSTAALIIGLALAARFGERIVRLLPRRLPEWLRDAGVQFFGAVGRIGARTSLLAYGLSVLAWMGDVGLVWICARALGFELSAPAAVAISLGAALGTALPAASGYLGTYELGAVALGTLVGTPSETVLAIAVLAHVFAIIPFALLGLVAVLSVGVTALKPSTEPRLAPPVNAGAGPS